MLVAEYTTSRRPSGGKTIVHKAHANYSALAIAFDSEGRESIELSDAYKADEMEGLVRPLDFRQQQPHRTFGRPVGPECRWRLLSAEAIGRKYPLRPFSV